MTSSEAGEPGIRKWPAFFGDKIKADLDKQGSIEQVLERIRTQLQMVKENRPAHVPAATLDALDVGAIVETLRTQKMPRWYYIGPLSGQAPADKVRPFFYAVAERITRQPHPSYDELMRYMTQPGQSPEKARRLVSVHLPEIFNALCRGVAPKKIKKKSYYP